MASLCHDIGKTISVMNHPAMAAEILRPYVGTDTYNMVLLHQDFQGRHYFGYIGMDPAARDEHLGQPWYALAEQFADEWDQNSFDPDYPTKPLSHFEPMVRVRSPVLPRLVDEGSAGERQAMGRPPCPHRECAHGSGDGP